MKRHLIITKPAIVSDLKFDDLDLEMNEDWLYKARRLQARRWRALKQKQSYRLRPSHK